MSNLNYPVAVGYDANDGKSCVTIHIGADLGNSAVVGISPNMARHVAALLLLTAEKLDPTEDKEIEA
jgi:hypothetical protein